MATTSSLPPTSPFVPRYYQKQQVRSLFNARDLNKMQVVINSPTGSGKTSAMALAAAGMDSYDRGAPVLVCIPFLSLLGQTVKTFERFFPREKIGVVQADTREYGRQVLIASTQTVVQPGVAEAILRGWKGRRPLMLNFDECHERALTDRTRRFFDAMTGPETQRTGWSATPNPTSGHSLRPVFSDGIISCHSMLELILNGFLVRIEGHDIPTDLDLGDFFVDGKPLETDDEGAGKNFPLHLQQRLERSNRYERGFQSWQHYLGPHKRTILFGQNVPDLYRWQEHFRAHGQDGEVIESRHGIEKRKDILTRFEDGSLPIVFSYNVLGTGLDMPSVEGIIETRVNISKNLVMQHVGRGTRLCPEIGKDRCIFLNLTNTHHVFSAERDLTGMTTDSSDAYRRRLLVRKGEEEGEEQETTEVAGETQQREESQQPYEIQARLRRIEAAAYNVFTGDGWAYNGETDMFVKDAGPLGRLLVEGDFLGGYRVRHLSARGRATWIEGSNERPLSALEARAAGAAHLEYRRKERSKATDKSDPARALPMTDGQWEKLSQRKVTRIGTSPQEARAAAMTQGDYYDLYDMLKRHGAAYKALMAKENCRGKVPEPTKKKEPAKKAIGNKKKGAA